jgi:hypothetical protein
MEKPASRSAGVRLRRLGIWPKEVIDSFLAFSTAMGEAKMGEKLHNQVKLQ